MAGVLLCASFAIAQTKTITGTVRDEKGDPIPFATISDAATKVSTTADANGNFTIRAAQGAVLTVTAVGHRATTVTVTGDTVAATLASTGTLQEVVVTTALGVKRQAREVGYSTATVNGNEANQTRVVNPATGLTGKVSGLQIQTSDNSINPQVRVTLRGTRSITGNNQALTVVDGVIVENSFIARLNPNDIESWDILKGASASAIYGSEASNGVLIITTRKGSRGKPRVNFSSTVQMETVSYMPKLQERFGSYGGEDFGQLLGVQFPEDPTKIYFPYENQSYGPEYNGQLVPLGGPVRIFREDGTFFDSTLMVPYSPVKNGKRKFFDRGMTYQNNVSFSSGDAQSSFYISFQDVRVNGVVPKDKANRNTLRINGGKAYGKFRVDYNTAYGIERTDVAGGSYFQDRPVYWTVINSPQHVDLRMFKDWRNNPFASPNGYFNAYYGNPWWQIDQSRINDRNNSFIGNLKLGLQLTSWLNVSYNVGFQRTDRSYKKTKAGFKFADWAIADPWEAGAIPSSVQELKPSLEDFLSWRQRIQGDALITMSHNFGDVSARLLVGNTVWKRRTRSIDQLTNSLVIPDLFNISNRQGEPTVTESLVEQGLVGVYADLTLGYKDYLFLHASGRNDWVSVLSQQNRRFFYPGVDASFVFTDAIPSLGDSKVLSYGKVRASWARVGQVSVNPYSLDNVVNLGGGFPYGSQAGYTLSNTFNNPDLKPEFTTEKEFGFELGFLNNRINLQAAFYHTKTTNQTIPAQISSATGYTEAIVNLGSMTNKGVELDLRFSPLWTFGDVRWNFGANFSYNDNTVGQDLGGEISLGNSVYATPGKSYPYLKESDWRRDSVGRIIVDANTGFPSKAANLVGFGTTTPRTKIGLTTSFSFHGFTLSAVADARFGAVIFNDIGQDLDFTGISWYSAQAGRKPFIIPNSVIEESPGKFVPNTSVATIDGNWRFWANTWNTVGAPYVNSADYWKIREIALTYDFGKSILNRLKIVQSASISLIGRNLFMFRPKDNVWTDPEFSAAGTGNAVGTTNIFQTPPTRIYGATLNVTF